MTNTRRRRLLYLAKSPNAWHKRWYSQYCILIGEGLVGWSMGTAYLTDAGQEWLRRIKKPPLVRRGCFYLGRYCVLDVNWILASSVSPLKWWVYHNNIILSIKKILIVITNEFYAI